MPNNTTLESLEIEIIGNSQKAGDGIGNLIAPLRSLAKGVGAVVPALREMNMELKKLAKFGNIKIPGLSKAIEQANAGRKASKNIAKSAEEAEAFAKAQSELDVMKMKQHGTLVELGKELGKQEKANEYRLGSLTQRYKNISNGISKTKTAAKAISQATGEVGKFNKELVKAESGITKEQLLADKVERQRYLDKVRAMNQEKKMAEQQKQAKEDTSFKEAQQREEQMKQNAKANAWYAIGRRGMNAADIIERSSNLDLLKFKYDALKQSLIDGARAGTLSNKQLAQGAMQLRNIGEQIERASEGAQEATKKTSALAKAFGRITKIASTMLIRQALRSLMKAFGESWNAAYEFSKKMGGTFAKSVDAAKTILSDTVTTLVQTFAPVLQALVPVFNVIGQAIQYLCQGLQELLKLLGLTSDLFGASTSEINKYTGSAKGAGKANKGMLASWDQLNIIQSKSGSGGSGAGAYNPKAIKDLVSDEINAILAVVAGEAMLAVGLILCATGHIGAGIGLMAVGAASITKVLKEDWKKLPTQIKKTIAEIMTIVGLSSLALGVILAFTGHVGLGIGLIALGVANIAAVASVAWGDDVINGIKDTVSRILAIGGSLMLGLGIILLFTGAGTALGIGMILAGGVALGTAVALNWNSVVDEVRKVLEDIGGFFSRTWHGISEWVSEAWDNVSKWWTENISAPLERAWGSVSNFFGRLFGNSETEGSIAHFARNAWSSISTWWNTNVGSFVERGWENVSSFFKNLWEGSDGNGGIKGWATGAWNSVSTWWETNVSENVEKEGVWGGIKGFFKGIFIGDDGQGGIMGWSNQAFSAVLDWVKDSTGIDIKGAWESVGTFFSDLWGNAEEGTGIAGWASNAFKSASEWWTTNVTSKIQEEGVWGGVKGFFQGLWGSAEEGTGIAGFFNSAWESISKLWGDIMEPIKNAWKDVAEWFHNNITRPIGNFFIGMLNGIIDAINWVINKLNSVMTFTIPGLELPLIGTVWETTVVSLGHINTIERIQEIPELAGGAYGIPNGDLFIANEAGPELVGSMNGKTTVANQEQIIEGIRRGVSDANSEQNALLRRQNELLIGLLEKEWEVNPSADWGKFNQRSAEMWAMATGR